MMFDLFSSTRDHARPWFEGFATRTADWFLIGCIVAVAIVPVAYAAVLW